MGNNLTFNILTFEHPKDEYTFYFTDKEKENLNRIHHNLVPDEVIEHFEEQEHYYTSFDLPFKGVFEIIFCSSCNSDFNSRKTVSLNGIWELSIPVGRIYK